MSRLVGDVLPKPKEGRWKARCTMASCPWSYLAHTEQEARQAVLSHAWLEHPAPIPVYDEGNEDD